MNEHGLIDASTQREFRPPTPKELGAGPPRYAEVNHGRWIVRCGDCPGAEMADPANRTFWCNGCYNVNHGHHLLRVIWPDDPGSIARALRDRPPEAKNWQPGELIAELQAENLEHGLLP